MVQGILVKHCIVSRESSIGSSSSGYSSVVGHFAFIQVESNIFTDADGSVPLDQVSGGGEVEENLFAFYSQSQHIGSLLVVGSQPKTSVLKRIRSEQLLMLAVFQELLVFTGERDEVVVVGNGIIQHRVQAGA